MASRFGVSPAYFISRFQGSFGPDEIASELPGLADRGFTSAQLEVFRKERLRDWSQTRNLWQTLAETGVDAKVFVAHFLGETFTTEDGLASAAILDTLTDVLGILRTASGLETLVLPLPPWVGGDPTQLWTRFLVLAEEASAACQARDLRLAFEVMPGALCRDYIGLHDLLADREEIGVCLDTGHIHASGLSVPRVIRHWSSRVYAVHLCDNNAAVNANLPPGDGTIAWAPVLAALDEAGYRDSLDLEIICPPEEAAQAYEKGRAYLQRVPVARP